MARLLHIPFWAILGLGLLLRLIWVGLIPVEPVSDSNAYLTFATNIYQHGVYGFTPDEPTAYWAVGPAALYAFAFSIFGSDSFAGVIVVNMISSTLILALLWDLGRRWYSENTGRMAALVFAIWPLCIQFTTVLASELHFMALVLLALASWDRSGNQIKLTAIMWLGLSILAFSGATYMRPIALLIPVALALASILRSPRASLPTIFKAALTVALIFVATAPWSARNERIFGEPVFMSTNFGSNFWMGNHPGTNGEYTPLPPETSGMGQLERDAYLEQVAMDYIAAEPGAFVARTLRKALRLHQRETIGVAWNLSAIERLMGQRGPNAVKLLSTGYWYLMLAGALVGIVMLARQQGAWVTLLSTPVWVWLYFVAVHAVIVVGDRYHMPAIPMIALLAGAAIAAALERRRQQQQPA